MTKAIKLKTLRYLLSLYGKESQRVWKEKSNVYICIENWTTPKYYLLSALQRNGYKTTQINNSLTYLITK